MSLSRALHVGLSSSSLSLKCPGRIAEQRIMPGLGYIVQESIDRVEIGVPCSGLGMMLSPRTDLLVAMFGFACPCVPLLMNEFPLTAR
jgi:hypothetical protein